MTDLPTITRIAVRTTFTSSGMAALGAMPKTSRVVRVINLKGDVMTLIQDDNYTNEELHQLCTPFTSVDD